MSDETKVRNAAPQMLKALLAAREWFADYAGDYEIEPTEPTGILIAEIDEAIRGLEDSIA